MDKKQFSWKERGNSFSYAAAGLRALFRTEHNARIHGALTLAAGLMGYCCAISRTEWMLLLIVMGGVWTAELFNTAIEKAMDHITREHHPGVGLVKDLAAAAVLVSALSALAVGALIFIPKLL